jgi:hypothetical protein
MCIVHCLYPEEMRLSRETLLNNAEQQDSSL